MIELLIALTLAAAIFFGDEDEKKEIPIKTENETKEINTVNINGTEITTITRKEENEKNE